MGTEVEAIDYLAKQKRSQRIVVGGVLVVAVAAAAWLLREPSACESLVQRACDAEHLRIMHCGRLKSAMGRGELSEQECQQYDRAGGLRDLRERLPAAAYSPKEAAERDGEGFAHGLRKPTGS